MMLTIYTKTTCGYCHLLKKQLKKNDYEFEEINLDHDEEAREFIKEAGHKTVPQIYRDGELFIEGGYDGFMKYIQEQQETQNTLESLGDI